MSFTVIITDWGFPSIDTERSILEGRGHQVLDYQCRTEDERNFSEQSLHLPDSKAQTVWPT